jgi:predicted PurR-regulated permease PerM
MAKSRSVSPLFILVAVITTIAALYFAKAILLPVALAILLCFLLSPLADGLERWHVPRILSVIACVAVAVAILGGVGYIVGDQVVQLGRELPAYKQNLIAKVRALRPSSTIKKVNETLTELRSEFVEGEKKKAEPPPLPPPEEPTTAATPEPKAQPSAERQTIELSYEALLEQVQNWLSSLVTPLATLGMVIILVFFILLDRENQRSRIVQLFGRSHLHTTTAAIHDVAKRVGRYLRMLFVVNATYGMAVSLGLALIGVPGALMWGVLAFSLRFLPYLGPWIAAVMPIFVSIAISPGWTQPLLVAGWYIMVELISNNIVEPMLYGSSIGISTVGVIVSAIFWTWLWGPVGLILAMPMTVCLIVIARYIPQLRFITILLADQPPMSVPERVYQRLLAFDYMEPLKLAQKHVKDSSVTSYYDDILIPTLTLAEQDRYDDLLSDEQASFVLEAADDLVHDLGEPALAAISEQVAAAEKPPGPATPPSKEFAGTRVLCVPLRDQGDEIASHMLAQLLVAEGFDVATEGAKALTNEVVDRVADSESDVVVISVLPPVESRDTRLLWRRLRNRYPNLPIVVGFWNCATTNEGLPTPENDPASKIAVTLAEAVAIVRALAVQHNLSAKTA